MQIRSAPEWNLGGLWGWWISELSSFIPESDPRREANRKTTTELVVSSAGLELYRRQYLAKALDSRLLSGRSALAEAGSLPLRGGETLNLTFDLATSHRRRLHVPQTAKVRIDDILALRVADLNPYTQQTPLHFYGLANDDTTLEVDHAILRKDVVDQIANQLISENVRIAAIAVRDERSASWPLLREPDGASFGSVKEASWRRRFAFSSSCFLVASIIALAVGWQRQNSVIADVQSQIEQLQPAAVKVRKTLEATDAKNELARIATDLKSNSANVPGILNQLSQLLPDHTWVQNVSIHGKTVQLDGLSADAESLIQVLEASSHFANVRFSAPVFKNPNDNRFHYAIAADLEAGAK